MNPGTDRFLVLIILVIFKKHIGHPLLQTENRCLTKLYKSHFADLFLFAFCHYFDSSQSNIVVIHILNSGY